MEKAQQEGNSPPIYRDTDSISTIQSKSLNTLT